MQQTPTPARTALFGTPVPATDALGTLAAAVEERLAAHHAALVTDFPRDPEPYIALLSRLGTPLPNYAGADGDRPAYALHPSINVVKCQPGGTERASRPVRGLSRGLHQQARHEGAPGGCGYPGGRPPGTAHSR